MRLGPPWPNRWLVLAVAWVLWFLLSPFSIYPPNLAHSQAQAFWPRALDTRQPPLFFCQVIHAFPHDPEAFTQGLAYKDGYFYEGTGLKGQSSLRKVVPQTGRVIKSKPLPGHFFGEGITVFKNRLIQLTWKAKTAFVYDRDSFQQVRTFSWPGEGWGITTANDRLIISDGSDQLYFLDPETFQVSDTILVRDPKGPVVRLNELEFVEGFILANIWQTDRIAVIVPETGQVAAWIVLDKLIKGPWRGVPNGIAYDPQKRHLYLTGKRWPQIFEVALISAQK